MSTRTSLTLSFVLAFAAATIGTPASATQPAFRAIGAKLRAQALARQDAGAPAEDVVAGLARAALMDPNAADTWSALAVAVGSMHPSAPIPTPAERVAWRIAEAAGATPDPAIAAALRAPVSVSRAAVATTTPGPSAGTVPVHEAEVLPGHGAAGRAGPASAISTYAGGHTVESFVEQARAGVAHEWLRVRHARAWAVLRVAAENWERDFRSGLEALHPYRPSLVLLALTLLALLTWTRSRARPAGQQAAPDRRADRLREARRLAHSGALRTEVARSTGLARDAIEMLAPEALQPDRSSVSGRNFRTELARHGVVGARLNHVIA